MHVEGGHQDDISLWEVLFDKFSELESIHPRHGDVTDYEGKRLLCKDIFCFGGFGSGGRLEADVLDYLGAETTNLRNIVNY